MDILSRRSPIHGKIHPDTACVSVGNLLVIVFLQTSESGGVKFLHNDQRPFIVSQWIFHQDWFRQEENPQVSPCAEKKRSRGWLSLGPC